MQNLFKNHARFIQKLFKKDENKTLNIENNLSLRFLKTQTMPVNIKVDCYWFHIKRKGKRGHTALMMRDLLKEFLQDGERLSQSKRNCLARFHSSFRNAYSNEFQINDLETKGIAFNQADVTKVSATNNTVTGIFKGGGTGIERMAHERNNTNDGDSIDRYKVSTLPCYYKLWIPPNSNFGIAVIQSYGSDDLGGFFMKILGSYLSSIQFKIFESRRFLPQQMIEEYRTNSRICSLTLSKAVISRQKRAEINPLLEERDSTKISISLSGFGMGFSWNEFTESMAGRGTSFFGVDLSNLGMNDDNELVVEYEYQGVKAKGKYSTSFNIVPSLIINDQVDVNIGNNHPVFNSVDDYCTNLLEDLKVEIGYVVEENRY